MFVGNTEVKRSGFVDARVDKEDKTSPQAHLTAVFPFFIPFFIPQNEVFGKIHASNTQYSKAEDVEETRL